MNFREATIADIEQIQIVRHSVRENQLSDPNLVTDEDCRVYLTERGKGWVCELNNRIVGFAIADLIENNIWALFVHPDFEAKGIGSQLHDLMLTWYFSKSKDFVWLSTAPDTRAEKFYLKHGWTRKGFHGKGELRFEMTFTNWKDGRSY